MQRYSNLFVECRDPEVQRLYTLLSLFFAKCDNLVSNSQVEEMMGDLRRFPFDPCQTPVNRRDLVLVRLKFLKKYNISNPQEIIRILTWGLFTTEKFNSSDRRYLIEFVENPDKSFSWFAKDLGVSTSTVFEAYHRLNKRIQFRFGYACNFPLLKMKHLIVFFKTNEAFKASWLSRDFTLSINVDTFGDWKWASFLVPNQTRILREFVDSLKKFGYDILDDYRLYEVKSLGKSCNLSMFDGEKWIQSDDVLGVGTFKFAERTGELSPRLNEYKYALEPMKFDNIDFLLACLRYGNARSKNSELKDDLGQYGYDISWVTLAKRLTSLKRKGLFIPFFGFFGLGLNSASAYAVECDDQLLETLYRSFPQLPECTASRTDKGVVFMVRTPAESALAVSYLVQTALRDQADRLIVANRLQNIGTTVPTTFYKCWNADKQFWEFERGHFDLTKRLE
jgi:DNA-binding Lrp family transcriptional regulator